MSITCRRTKKKTSSSRRPTRCSTNRATSWQSDWKSVHRGEFRLHTPRTVDYLDLSPKQIVSVAASLIPFLEHDDANRALMGANMQRQAVPLVRPEIPLVGTGMELQTASRLGAGDQGGRDGVVTSWRAGDANQRSSTTTKSGLRRRRGTYALNKFIRSNQGTCINHRAIVRRGEQVTAGQTLADSSSTDSGELALGQTLLCAFMSWEGYNFEDAIIISETVARRTTSSPRSTSRSTRSRRATRSLALRRSPATSRTSARKASSTSTSTASSA